MRNKFKIKSGPKKPERKTVRKELDIEDYSCSKGRSLEGIIEWAAQYTDDFGIVFCGINYSCCYYEGDQPTVMFYLEVPETDEEYEQRCTYYYTKKEKYDEWHSENKERIEGELALREKEAEKELVEKAGRNKKKAAREIEKLEKKLGKLKEVVGK